MHTVTRNKGKKGFGRVFIMSRSRHVEKIGSGSSQVFQGSMRCVKSSFPLRIIVFDELELIIKSGPDPIDCKYSFSFCPIVQYDFSVSPRSKSFGDLMGQGLGLGPGLDNLFNCILGRCQP